ncbi:MAG: CbbQ/NirQ/NorQ/GpvN family protein [Polyangiaceae bacterium]|nr:CbbQ/NirQ/NorQ/GpvN family protein [Polyangiaceae bacterium]
MPQPSTFYRPITDECAIFQYAFAQKLPLCLKGPTGTGKSRFVEAMAERLGRPLVTVACHDETSAVDLVGRYLIRGGETQWQDGPVTRAVRAGAILYLDEIAEARPDVIVVLHPLSDHRRVLYIEQRDEVLAAADGFHLVVSFNPGYQRGLKELKASTRQRFVSLAFDYPDVDVEVDILVGETGVDRKVARRLSLLAQKVRKLDHLGLAERPSTRLLVDAAKLVQAGLAPRRACQVAIVESLTDDPDVRDGLNEAVALAF